MKFTKQEYADLQLLYGEARGSTRGRSPSVPLYFCGATSAFMRGWFRLVPMIRNNPRSAEFCL
jgi:hypothetical protein